MRRSEGLEEFRGFVPEGKPFNTAGIHHLYIIFDSDLLRVTLLSFVYPVEKIAIGQVPAEYTQA